MKTKNLIQVSFLAIAVMTIGCAQKKSSSTTSTVVVPVTDPTTGIPTPGTGTTTSSDFPDNGATSGLSGVLMSDLNILVANYPINAPSEVKIYLNLKQIEGDYPYAGKVKIGFQDNGKWNVMEFSANSGWNSDSYNLNYSGYANAHFNRWFLLDNQKVFSGFFEGKNGAIVITIDKAQSQGDGQGEQYLTGTVWFKMFRQAYAPHPPERQCWFITVGPYACYSDTIMNKTSLTPSNGYKKLGTFKGINKSVAFKR